MVDKKDEQQPYLASSEVIDWQDSAVRRQAEKLAAETPVESARNCFEFVRDAIAHSLDINAGKLTCSASEVLNEGHGYCYARSHLLAALLRANGIPAGFDYQRLGDGEGGFVLHGITTLYLPGYGWYRVDPRGNKPGVCAGFSPPLEQLAWQGDGDGEVNYRMNLSQPLAQIVEALRQPLSVQQLLPRLPADISPP